MFDTCHKCQALEDEVIFLRETNQKLTDRLVAMVSPQAYQAVSFEPVNKFDYYGNDGDEYIEHDMFGQKVIVEKDREPKP